MKNVFSFFAKYFLRGVLFFVPVATKVWVIIKSFIFIDSIIPIKFPGLGALTLLSTIFIFGVLASTVLAQPFIFWGNEFLKSAPLIKTIYTSIKDLVSAFVGTQKKFDRPVLVKLNPNSELRKIGFLTSDDLSELNLGEELVSVYLPHSYAFSGNLFVVPRSQVSPIDAKPSDVMKYIVSGGVTKMSDLED
jgi:uncharacterized membrane protein